MRNFESIAAHIVGTAPSVLAKAGTRIKNQLSSALKRLKLNMHFLILYFSQIMQNNLLIIGWLSNRV